MSVGAGAVDVGETDAALVELIRRVEPRRVVHRDLGAEPAVAEVAASSRPRRCGCARDRSGRRRSCRRGRSTACRRRTRGAGRLLRRAPGARVAAGPKPSSASDGCQTKRVVLGDQHVGVAVAGRDRRSAGWDRASRTYWQRCERTKWLPAFCVVVRAKKPGVGPSEVDQIELPVAGKIQQLLPAARLGMRRGRQRRPASDRGESNRRRLGPRD